MRPFISRYGRLIAVLVVVVVVALFFVGGALKVNPSTAKARQKASDVAEAKTPQAKALYAVMPHDAEVTELQLAATAQTVPERSVQLAAEVEGKVVSVLARKGSSVAAGAVIARVDARDWALHQQSAEARLRQTEMEYAAAEKLRGQNYITEGELAARNAALQAARASLADARFQLSHLEIRAPFAGTIEEQLIEPGSYVRPGQTVAKIIVTQPLRVRGAFNEAAISQLRVGNAATAHIAGQEVSGVIRYIAPQADEATRTFAVEVEIDNRSHKFPAGLSAKLAVPGNRVTAHVIPSALLTLGDDGTIGVKHVDANRKIILTPVTILRSQGGKVWVSGLPERINLITEGQGFAKVGEVLPSESAAKPSAAVKN